MHDIDRDGRLDVALGASWQPTNTSSGGTLHWVKQGAPGAAWTLHSIAEEPTLHRIRWADVDGDGNRELIVTPLHGRGTKGPDWQGQGARILVFTPPANPARDPWPVEVVDDTLHIVHNFLPVNMDDTKAEEILTASREGVSLLHRATKTTIKADSRIKTDLTVSWLRTLIGEGAPGEIKLGRVSGRRMLATVEPWHGKSVVIYAEQPGVWARTVIESEITGGHALGWADFDGDGNDELAVGWRDREAWRCHLRGRSRGRAQVEGHGRRWRDGDGGSGGRRPQRRQAAGHHRFWPRDPKREDLLERNASGGPLNGRCRRCLPSSQSGGGLCYSARMNASRSRVVSRTSSRPRVAVLVLVATLTTAFPLAVPAPQPATARAQSGLTALDRYVAAPDTNFTWKVVRELPAEGVTATLVEMTSQQWLTDKEVERPLWTHWLTIVRPAAAAPKPPSADSGQ